MLWGVTHFTRPMSMMYFDTFDMWARRHGLDTELERLEKRRLLKWKRAGLTRRVPELSEKALRRLGGTLNPEEAWERPWDGFWRIVCFDIPESQRAQRKQLRNLLKKARFGYMQRSFWVSPDAQVRLLKTLHSLTPDPGTIIAMESRTIQGRGDCDIVQSAWRHEELRRLHRDHLDLLKQRPKGRWRQNPTWPDLAAWLEIELESWREISLLDPLLPSTLIPGNYLGKKVWDHRTKALATLIR